MNIFNLRFTLLAILIITSFSIADTGASPATTDKKTKVNISKSGRKFISPLTAPVRKEDVIRVECQPVRNSKKKVIITAYLKDGREIVISNYQPAFYHGVFPSLASNGTLRLSCIKEDCMILPRDFVDINMLYKMWLSQNKNEAILEV